MKITNSPNIQQIMKSYGKNVGSVKKKDDVKLSPDKIEISSEAKEFQIAMQAFKKLPDVRDDKVDELKDKIKDGSYKPSSEDIAKKLLESLKNIE